MKLIDLATQYPEDAMTVEELLSRFVKKPSLDRADEHHLSSTDILKHLGCPDSIARAKRTSAWLKRNGFYNVNDAWCWRVAFAGTPEAPQFIY